MARTVADQIVTALVRAGVERLYGIVGDSMNPVTDAVRREGSIRWIHVRHEEVAAFAAGAEAELSGQLAVCVGSSGPGHLHLINGLYECHRSNVPVLAIAAHIPSKEVGSGYFQETHPTRVFGECSCYCELVMSPEQMPRVLQSAIQSAISLRGVAVVAMPGDVAGLGAQNEALEHAPAMGQPRVLPAEDDLKRLADRLSSARSVTLYCGAGCAGAHDEVVALADRLKAPVGFALRGKQFIEYDNPYEVGMTGLLGYGGAYGAMHDCDVLLLLGTDFPYEQFMPRDVTIAQVDIRGERLGRRSRLDLGLCGDVKETIRALLPNLTPKDDTHHLEAARSTHAHVMERLRAYVEHPGKKGAIRPEYLASMLNELAGPDAIFTMDTGTPTIWAARYLRAAANRRLIGSFMHGSMANAMPQAIGAQFLRPDRQVIALSGDGGFTMLLGDLLTIMQYNLPVKVVIFDNGELDFVKIEMLEAGFPDWQTDLWNPNFARMAEAIGALGVRIEDPSEVRPGLERALSHDGPAIIDVLVEPNALALPPHVTFGQVEGFALAMAKEALSHRMGEVIDTAVGNVRLVHP
ncbi:MAG TPA: ubiquinone-dependent pyruvate dehydrogenase [Candidatus Dormibacteraeota bacterium]